MTQEQAKWYGVSYGDGNNGISHMSPAFYVFTNDPWTLAKVATIFEFKPGAGQSWAIRHMDVDGEADYTISAVLYDPPCEDTKDGEYPDVEDPENAEDGRNYCEFNGAWFICDVSLVENFDKNNTTKAIYDSLEDAFNKEILELAKE